MNNELEVFKNEEFGNVRTLSEGDAVLFCASDVAKALGYTNPSKAVGDHCPHVTKREVGVQTGKKVDGSIAMQTVNASFIPEGDVYRLIVRSKLPSAEKFERWVFDDVLPTIRKHGAYMTQETLENAILNPDYLLKVVTALKEETDKRKALEQKNSEQKQLITEMEPKVTYCDMVLKSKDLIPVTQIAKDYGMSAVTFNKLLNNLKIQYRSGDCWVLYQKYADKGYTKSTTYVAGDEKSVIHTYWTQKGRLFLYENLKKNGTLPMMEK